MATEKKTSEKTTETTEATTTYPEALGTDPNALIGGAMPEFKTLGDEDVKDVKDDKKKK